MRIGSILMTVILIGLLCSGCGNANGKKPVYPARAKVQFEGRDLPGAFVVLHPVGATDPAEPRPFGVAGADGVVELTTYQQGDGAPAGEYVATVEYRQPPKNDDDNPLLKPNLLATRYSNPATSGLKLQIKEGANDLAPIKLAR